MKISYDPKKNARNIAERRLNFERAADFEWETASIAEDDRKNYPERCFVAVGVPRWQIARVVLHANDGRHPGHQLSPGEQT